MNKLGYFILALALYCQATNTLLAQEKPAFTSLLTEDDSSLQMGNPNDFIFLYRNTVKKELKGNPFLSSSWQEGILVDKLGRSYPVNARYEVLHDEIQLLVNEDLKTVHAQSIEGIRIANTIFVATEFEMDDQEQFGYLELLSEGKICLFKRHEASANVKGGETWVVPEKPRYFYTIEDEPVKELELRRKDVFALFDEKEDLMKEYIREKNLDYNKETDLVQLVAHYNSLAKS